MVAGVAGPVRAARRRVPARGRLLGGSRCGHAAGADPSAVLFTHPLKAAGDIARARRGGLWRFAADSDTELTKIARYSPGATVLLCIDAGDGARWATRPSSGSSQDRRPGWRGWPGRWT